MKAKKDNSNNKLTLANFDGADLVCLNCAVSSDGVPEDAPPLMTMSSTSRPEPPPMTMSSTSLTSRPPIRMWRGTCIALGRRSLLVAPAVADADSSRPRLARPRICGADLGGEK